MSPTLIVFGALGMLAAGIMLKWLVEDLRRETERGEAFLLLYMIVLLDIPALVLSGSFVIEGAGLTNWM